MLINLHKVNNEFKYEDDLNFIAIEISKYIGRDDRLTKIEKYLEEIYKIKVNLVKLLKYIFTISDVIIQGGYYCLKTDSAVKYENLKLDTILRLVIYGNRDIQGSQVINNAVLAAINAIM